MANVYTKHSTPSTPQLQPIPGREKEMVANNAGGFSFVLDDWERLNRFLIIGSEGGTYYVGEQTLTMQNAGAAVRCIKIDGPRVVEMARAINVENRAPKTDQQLFVLALAMKCGDDATKAAVAEAVPQVVRTGTHLLHFVALLDSLGGWNRAKRRLITNWFANQDADSVAFQMLKYQNRGGWTMRDVLRIAHVVAPSNAHDAAFAWATNRLNDEKAANLPAILADYRTMTAFENTPVAKALWGIAHRIPREALPTEAVNTVDVQRAMLATMPLHALIRNLANLTASGLLANTDEAATVVSRLTNAETLHKSRVHPFAILLASLVYRAGKGPRGAKTWIPVASVLGALDDAYDLAFQNVPPTGKRLLIAIDTSGSMGGNFDQRSVVRPIDAAAAMAVTLARLEPHATVIEVDTTMRRLVPITKRTGISGIQHHGGGGTDMAIPMEWASKEKHTVDCFVILTDNETWFGRSHPTQALEAYRLAFNQQAKLVVCAMTANHANIVDPLDSRQFGCAGLDANLPALVAEFVSH